MLIRRSPYRLLSLVVVWLGISISAGKAQEPAFSDAQLSFFESRIRPVLVEKCYECHSADSNILRGGLQLDSRQGLIEGGDSGPSLVPGDATNSLLMEALRHESYEMPPDEKLSDEVINDFETWIKDGAADPREEARPPKLAPVDWDGARQHWSFQPIPEVTPPLVDSAWVVNPIDQFVIAALQEQGFAPAPPADKRTLIRRVTFDLTGLPPTVEEVDNFLNDDSPDSYARLIDRLLDSPRYGERWGRHWLDLVRYATTNGADENHQMPNAWRFRDWVVRMINQDLPLDQFIIQQLAGDLLEPPEDEQLAGDLLTATGMLVLGPKMLAEQDKDKMMIDIVDEQIDTVSRTMLGLTVACARCHDHKFDPISAEDYYSLAGIFYSTKAMANRDFVSQWMERPLPSAAIEALRAEHQPKIDAVKAELEKLKSPEDDEAIAEKKKQLEQLEKEMPQFEMVMAATEAEPVDLPVHIRGNHLQPGPEPIPRGMPGILTEVAPANPIAAAGSGRLELARWLVAPENPLTSRVMMNRIWMWHFGEALMRSPSNWGLQAEEPKHVELLNWLALQLQHSGWSLKAMHRLIMLSATYQMSSQHPAAEQYVQRDPGNEWLWKQNRRRLEAEPVRDSILFVGGGLDESMGNIAADVQAPRRAIYLPVNRAALYEMFSTFDYVETANHIEQRPVTTVPNQALFLMNSEIVHGQSQQLIEQLSDGQLPEPSAAGAVLVKQLYEQLVAREPEPREIDRCLAFVAETEQTLSAVDDAVQRRQQAWAALCRTILASNEFMFVE